MEEEQLKTLKQNKEALEEIYNKLCTKRKFYSECSKCDEYTSLAISHDDLIEKVVEKQKKVKQDLEDVNKKIDLLERKMQEDSVIEKLKILKKQLNQE